MQFSKTSNKTRNKAEETAAGSEVATSAETSQPRTNRSSKSKNSEPSETGSVKHRGAAAKSAGPEQPAPAPEQKAMAVAAGASQSGSTENSAVTHEEIAKLAHSYWVSRGYASGSPEQDWLRAERELKTRR